MGTDAAQPRGGRAQLNRMALALGAEPPRTTGPTTARRRPTGWRTAAGRCSSPTSSATSTALMPALAHAADQGVRGCFVQVLDESEEVFPFDGRMIFESMGGTHRVRDPARAGAARGLRRAAGRAAGRARATTPATSAGAACSTTPASRRARRCSGSTWRSASGRDSMIGPVAFLAPWLLLGLAALPVLWWLLRAVPPAPGRRPFPGRAAAARADRPREDAGAHAWWLLLLRMLALAAAILAFAGPVLNPRPEGSGAPLLVLLDGGWGDAPDWARRMDRAAAALDEAARDGRPAAVVAMAAPPLRRRGARRGAPPRTGPSGWPASRRAPGRRTAPPGPAWIAGAGRAVRDAVADRRHRPRRRGRAGRARCSAAAR